MFDTQHFGSTDSLSGDKTVFTMKEHEAENPTVVTAEDFLPAINGCFEKLSELQWSMIKDGAWDSDVKALLADLISEVIQIASAKILRHVLPLIQSQTISEESPEDVMENINTSLGDSVSDSIASSLNVLKQTCKSAQKLTAMIEKEVEDKISVAISVLTQSPAFPSDPSIYVSGTVSNIKKLRRMISSVASCLRRYICQFKRCYMGREDHSSSSDESTTSITTVKSATSKVAAILSKWCKHTEITEDDSSDDVEEGMDMGLTDKAAAVEKHEESQEFTHTEGRAETIHDPISAEKAASEIVEIGFENLDSASDESSDASCSPKHDFDRSLMISKLREFLTSNLPSTGLAKLNVRRKLFLMFAEKQFEKMRKGLKRKLRLNRKYLIPLLNTAKPPQDERRSFSESSDLSLPGSVPQTPRPESSTSSRTSVQTLTPESTVKGSSPFNFDTIKSYVINLYNKLTKKEELYIDPDVLENTGNSVELRNFTRELTDKIFDLLMIKDIYEKPVPVMGRSLSDSVISRTPVHGSRRVFSHEVLYVLIEDVVEKYLQKIVLWLENKALAQTVQADLVSGALGDIQDFIRTAPTPTQEKDTESDALEQSGRESAASCPSRPASALSTAEQSIFLRRSSARSRRSASPLRSERTSLEETAATTSHAVPTSQPRISLSPEKSSARSRRSASPLRSERTSLEESSATSSDSGSTLSSESSSLEESSATSSDSVPTFRPRIRLSPEKTSARYRHSAPILRPRSTSREERYIRSCHSAPILKPKCTCLEKRFRGNISQPSPSEKSELGLSQVSVSSFDAQKLSKNLTSFLLIRIIVKSRKQHLLSSKETTMVLDRLQDLVNQQISNIESAANLEDSMYQFTKSLSKRLIKEFGSPNKVLKAAMACDSSFDEALLRNLKLDLGVFPSPPPKKSKVSRFFSAVRKAFLKPFRYCCKGSND